MDVSVDASDVIRIIMQYLQENNLLESMKVLKKESQIPDLLDNPTQFIEDIRHSRWNSVVSKLYLTDLSDDVQADLLACVVMDLCAKNEKTVARDLFAQADCFQFCEADQ